MILNVPRTSCGCGVCIPKARDAQVADLSQEACKKFKPAYIPEL